jgi:hypothetical protein
MRSRKLLAGTAMAVVIAVAGAHVVDAAPPSRPGSATSVRTNPIAPASAPVERSALQQTVHLNVVGGSIELETASASVILTPRPGKPREWIGTLPPVRVVDGRGTLEGWEIRWSLASVELDTSIVRRREWATVTLDPGLPVVVDGAPDGVRSGRAGPARPPGRALLRADPGTGGGTYEAAGTVTLKLPGSVTAEQVVVTVTFALH